MCQSQIDFSLGFCSMQTFSRQSLVQLLCFNVSSVGYIEKGSLWFTLNKYFNDNDNDFGLSGFACALDDFVVTLLNEHKDIKTSKWTLNYEFSCELTK